ncbi:hypothetical protein NBRC111893_1898 [Lentilactobacillus kosonis]|uniref:Ribonuclease Y N-terminal domain-containing protein n=1 Tax=Lentilactobacillus kosonis TaxID=2810561 RepID=A0A401FMZ2_9LACO|nr:hypothetical protein NBRC111893_1898 [Lentilactobacillus kosonis]
MNLAGIILAIIAILVVGIVGLISFKLGQSTQKKNQLREEQATNSSANEIIADAKKQADTLIKEAKLTAQEDNHRYRSNVENELKKTTFRNSKAGRQIVATRRGS